MEGCDHYHKLHSAGKPGDVGTTIWPLRLEVRTRDFHSRNSGSIPLGVTSGAFKSLELAEPKYKVKNSL